jgi:hypothetical protein
MPPLVWRHCSDLGRTVRRSPCSASQSTTKSAVDPLEMSSSNSQLRGTGPSERDRLLPTSSTSDGFGHASRRKSGGHVEGDASDSRNIGTILLFSTVAFLVIWVTTFQGFYTPWNPREWHEEPAALPEDPLERAHALLSRHPLIDGVGRPASALTMKRVQADCADPLHSSTLTRPSRLACTTATLSKTSISTARPCAT